MPKLSTRGLYRHFISYNSFYVVEETANFFRCSMNSCRETSSVSTGAPPSYEDNYIELVNCDWDWALVKRRQHQKHLKELKKQSNLELNPK